ncbi:MAG TPA: NAD-dependent epimerase/dehydratase family protein [Chthonomonadaceae bacterium]|nr:NAD-dependent epimerase/dehydratase family protein [Chthonomonadaceae bacterium]
MNLLILGGTVFVGRHLVEAALARGHTVTLFNRSQHNPELFPEVEKLRGDRDGDLGALQGRHWDAVLDTCGYVPRIVRASAELLADAVPHYTFISSISVYKDLSIPGMDENAPVGTLEDETTEEITAETYGPLKVLCEQAAEEAMPGRVLTIRPGLIVGPHDPTDRFTYWPHRVAQGGEVLAPGRPEQTVQFIDARDLAEWNIRLIEAGQTGVYNATGPDYPLTMGRLLDECKAVGGSDARFTWASQEFLQQEGVQPWTELPLWVPEEPDMAGFNAVNCDKAIAAGLTFRPLSDTIRDTLAWDATRPADREWRAGLKPERERELLEKPFQQDEQDLQD